MTAAQKFSVVIVCLYAAIGMFFIVLNWFMNWFSRPRNKARFERLLEAVTAVVMAVGKIVDSLSGHSVARMEEPAPSWAWERQEHTEIVQALKDNPIPREEKIVAIDLATKTAFVGGETQPVDEEMLQVALNEMRSWSMTTGVPMTTSAIPGENAPGIITMSMADYEEQIERSRKKFSDNFRIYEEAIFKKLPPWIVRYGYEFVCLRCKERLLCVGIQVPDTIDDIKAFAREHSLCQARREARDVLGEA